MTNKQVNYRIISEKDKVFHVKELATDQIVNTFDSRKDANKFIKRVDAGYAFSGFTPMFFNKVVRIDFK